MFTLTLEYILGPGPVFQSKISTLKSKQEGIGDKRERQLN